MTYQQSLQLFDIVNRNFKSESDARLFVTEIDQLISNSLKAETHELPTKHDLKSEIEASKNELLNEIAKTNKEIVNIKSELLTEIAKTNKEIANIKSELSTEIAKTNKEIANIKSELSTEIAKINKEIAIIKAETPKELAIIRSEITIMRGEIAKDISQAKFDQIKWMFGFWVTIVLLIIGTFYLRK